MIKKGTIEYELHIKESHGHGIKYLANLDSDVAGLLIAAQVLQHNLEFNKETKKQHTGPKRAAIAKNISSMSIALTELNKLVFAVCEEYERLQNEYAQEDTDRLEVAKEQGEVPKDHEKTTN